MTIESEIKLSLSARSARELAEHATLSDVQPRRQRLQSIYYDTPDRRLRHERILVRFRRSGRQWMLGVKTARPLTVGLAERGEWEVVAEPGHFDFAHVDDARIRGILERLVDQLQPAFSIRFRRDSWLLEPDQKVRVEVSLDRGWIEAQGQRQRIREVEIELLAGTVSDLFEVASALQASLPLHPEVSSKSDWACRLLDGAPLLPVKAQAVSVDGEMPAIAAFRGIALSCLQQLQSNEQGVCETEQPEFVHQARVAIRRLRSAIRLWEPILPEPFVARYDPLWQALATKLGDTRNWDVFLSETLPAIAEAFTDRGVIDQLSRRARRHCAHSRQASRKALTSADYSRLLIDFAGELMALPENSAGTLAAFVPRCLSRRARRVNERAVEDILADVVARHRLRVAFKQLRYALEFFSPILSGPLLADYLGSVTMLQEMLGRLNDLAVARQLTAAALPRRKAEAIDVWLVAQTETLLPEFAGLLAEFRGRSEPW